ncbi:hypothetical protein A4A49_53304, partial [Nicotiana attenuata]
RRKVVARRLKYRHATTNRLLANANHVNLDGTISHIQHDVNIGVAFPTSETVTVRGSFSSLDAYDKEKDMLHPFHVFEKGSTSGTTNKSCASTLETVATNG